MKTRWSPAVNGILLGSCMVFASSCRMTQSEKLGGIDSPPGAAADGKQAYAEDGVASFNLDGDYVLFVDLRVVRTLPNTIKATVKNKRYNYVPVAGINVSITAIQGLTNPGEIYAGGTDGMIQAKGAVSTNPQSILGTEIFVPTDIYGKVTAYIDASTPGYTTFRVSIPGAAPQYFEFSKPGIVINDYFISKSNITSISVSPLRPLYIEAIAKSLATANPRIKLSNLSQREPRVLNSPLHMWRIYDSNENHPVDLSTAIIKATGGSIRIEFPNGIGGTKTGATGNGFYQLTLDELGRGVIDATYGFSRLAGDVDGSKIVDARDVDYVGDACLSGATLNKCKNADANGDGVTDAKDRDLISSFRDYRIGF